MLKIAICDDDSKFTGELESLVIQESQKLGIIVDIDVFFDGQTLLSSIQNGVHYVLIFIDIEMEHVDGITAARHIRENDRSVLITYISGYENHLKELFEVEPFRFLSKPLDKMQFIQYFKDAYKRIDETDECFHYSFNKEIRSVLSKDIVYFESSNRVVNIFLKNGSQEYFYGKLNNIEKQLSEGRLCFLRIHQSYLVNYNYIKKMNFSNVTITYMGKEKDLKISEDRQKEVRHKLCELASGKV